MTSTSAEMRCRDDDSDIMVTLRHKLLLYIRYQITCYRQHGGLNWNEKKKSFNSTVTTPWWYLFSTEVAKQQRPMWFGDIIS